MSISRRDFISMAGAAALAPHAFGRPVRSAVGGRSFAYSGVSKEEDAVYKELFKATVERTVADIETDVLDYVGYGAFQQCTNIGNIYLPNVTRLEGFAFQGARIYGDISMPNLVSVSGSIIFGSSIFYGDVIDLPRLEKLNSNRSFYQALQMNPRPEPRTPITVNLDSCTEISDGAFYNDTGIGRLYAPNVTTITGGSTFLNVGDWRFDSLPEASLIVGDPDKGTGLSCDGLMSLADFPFGANTSRGKVVWYCNDGTVRYTDGAWTATPYGT